MCCSSNCYLIADTKLAGSNISVVPSTANPLEPCPAGSKAEREDRVVLWQAQAASEDKDWENAQKLYAVAMKSCSPEIAKQAHTEYDRVRQWSAGLWWDFPGFTPIYIRFARHPWACWILLVLLLVSLVGWLLWARLRRRHFRGQARLLLPSKLTEDGLPELFAAEVYQASKAVDECLRTAGQDYFAGALNLVSAPCAELCDLKDQLPDIGGVSLGKWVGFFFAVPRYFSWRVEMWQGFLSPGTNGQMRVRAMLRRASGIHQEWSLMREATDKFDVRTIAFALAARLKGETFSSTLTRQLDFDGAESFGLFVEGLYALQEYGRESDSLKPQKKNLDARLNEALSRLGQCAQDYPKDLLSRFYHGIALTVSNQALYVERLYARRDSFQAWGRLLDLQDDSGDVNAEYFKKKQQELAERAHQAQHLSEEDWSQLKQAAKLFEELQSCGVAALEEAATYNLAVVYGRLGGKQDIEKAATVLEDLKPLDFGFVGWVSRFSSKGRRRGEEALALSIQTHFEKRMMDCWLAARIAVLAGHSSDADRTYAMEKHEAASRELDSAFKAIQESDLPDDMCRDLEAELCTKRGYLQYELATSPDARSLLTGQTSKAHLHKSREFLEKALALKPHWNPAQVYLALVLEVLGEAADAESYFDSLRGVEKNPDSVSAAD